VANAKILPAEEVSRHLTALPAGLSRRERSTRSNAFKDFVHSFRLHGRRGTRCGAG